VSAAVSTSFAQDSSWVILKLAIVVGSVRSKFLEYSSAFINQRIAMGAQHLPQEEYIP
jgi:hypothetical protein